MNQYEECVTIKFQQDFFSFYEMKTELPSFTQIFHKNILVSQSFNLVETKQETLFHSEMNCIFEAKKNLNKKYLLDCVLITTLEPCLMCAGAIILSRIYKVIYFVPNEKDEGISSLSIKNVKDKNFFPFLKLVHNKEIQNLWRLFFQEKRKKQFI